MRNGENVVLLHIRDALVLVLEYAQVGEPAFMEDRKTQDAVLRRLEIVGEAVKRLPLEFARSIRRFPGNASRRSGTSLSTTTTAWISSESGDSSRRTFPCCSIK